MVQDIELKDPVVVVFKQDEMLKSLTSRSPHEFRVPDQRFSDCKRDHILEYGHAALSIMDSRSF